MRLNETRERQIAGIIEELDEQIATLQASKADTFEAVRDEVRSLGCDKDEVAEYMAGLKLAIKRHRLTLTNPEKAAASEAKADLADLIFHTISRPASRMREIQPTRESREEVTAPAPEPLRVDPIQPDAEQTAAIESCGSTDGRAFKAVSTASETLVLEPVDSTPNCAGRSDNPAMGMALRSFPVNDGQLAGSLSRNQDVAAACFGADVEPGPQEFDIDDIPAFLDRRPKLRSVG